MLFPLFLLGQLYACMNVQAKFDKNTEACQRTDEDQDDLPALKAGGVRSPSGAFVVRKVDETIVDKPCGGVHGWRDAAAVGSDTCLKIQSTTEEKVARVLRQRKLKEHRLLTGSLIRR